MEEFRRLRTRPLAGSSADPQDLFGAFHDRNYPSPVVRDWITQIKASADPVTSKILTTVWSQLLLFDPEKRLTAIQLCESIKLILDEAEVCRESSISPETSSTESPAVPLMDTKAAHEWVNSMETERKQARSDGPHHRPLAPLADRDFVSHHGQIQCQTNTIRSFWLMTAHLWATIGHKWNNCSVN